MGTESKLPLPESSASAQAAVWFARQRVAPLSEGDAEAFATWLTADPSHTVAWSEFERLWGRVEAVRDDPKILAMREEAKRQAARRVGVRYGGRLVAALAASIVLGVTVWWVIPNYLSGSGEASTVSGRMPLAPSAGQALVREASTQIGERSILILADGSKVTLNTASIVRADYSGPERLITLVRGEAFFDVAKDPTRPFIVTAGPRQVIAVGTAFNVRLQDTQVRVTLVEGRVQVSAYRSFLLCPGGHLASGVRLGSGCKRCRAHRTAGCRSRDQLARWQARV